MVDFLTKIGRTFGISNAEGANIAAQLATGNIGGAIGATIGSIGGDSRSTIATADTSPAPAGVDSPATLSRVSQTAQTFDPGSGFLGGPRMMPEQMMQQPSQAALGFIGPTVQLGKNILRGPGFGVGAGAAAGFVADTVTDLFGNEKKLVITRKLQREVKKVFLLSGGDFSFVSRNSMRLFKKSLTEDQIVDILFKTFKNQGPFVTKAAVRKTRSTIRKMETLCDLKDRLCPPKRAAPRRRTMGSTTRITQVK